MAFQQTAMGRKTAIVVALAVGAALTLAGCGGGGGDEKPVGKGSSATAHTSGDGSDQGASPTDPSPTAILAQLRGEKNILVTINEATRDSGGFVTVKGMITKNGDTIFNATYWTGEEVAVQKSGPSVAGAGSSTKRARSVTTSSATPRASACAPWV